MAKDPICGMTVDEAAGLLAERDGKTYYFCGESCRRKFMGEEAPAPPGSCCGGHSGHHPVAPAANAKYFCPMCPGVESDKPGE